MNKLTSLLALAALITPLLGRAEVTALSASPNPVRQGTTMQISAQVNRAGMVYFFFKGRPFGSAVNARGPGLVSTRDTVPGNTVPAGRSSLSKDYGAQQFGHRVSATVTVTR